MEPSVEISKEELTRRLQEMSDDELVSHLNGGALTPVALEVVTALLHSRGIQPAPQSAALDPAAGSASAQNDEQAATEEAQLVPVAQLLSPTEANALRACLESSGIVAYVWDEHVAAAQPAEVMLLPEVGIARVMVRADQLAQAQEVIAALERGELEIPEG